MATTNQRCNDAKAPLLEKSTEVVGGSSPARSCLATVWACLTFLPRLVWNNGVVCMTVAMIIYSFMWVVTKRLSQVHISVFEAIFYRSLFGGVVTTILCKVSGVTPLFGDRKMYGWLILRGIVGAIGMALVFTAFYMLPVGDASALQLLSTVFVVLFAWLWGWEKVGVMTIVGAVICTIGATLVSNPPFLHRGHPDWGSKRLFGIMISLLGAAATGISYNVVAKIGKSVNPMSITMWYHTPSLLMSIVPMLASFPAPMVIFMTWKQGLLLLSWVCLGFAGQLMMTRSFQLCKATTGASIQTTQVVYSYILAFLLLGEHVSYFAIGGTAVLGIGLMLVAEGKRKMREAAETDQAERVVTDTENAEV